MLGLFKATLTAAGLLLLIAAAVPLVEFYESIGGVWITYNTTNTTLIVTLHYEANPGMSDYRFAVLVNNSVVSETRGPLLAPGSNVTIEVPLSALGKNASIGYVIEGKVAGVYYVKFRVHGGGG